MGLAKKIENYYMGIDIIRDRQAYYKVTGKKFGKSISDLEWDSLCFTPRYGALALDVATLFYLSAGHLRNGLAVFLVSLIVRKAEDAIIRYMEKKLTAKISGIEGYAVGKSNQKGYRSHEISASAKNIGELFEKRHTRGAWQEYQNLKKLEARV
jgi:hypothetical protein